MTGGVECVREDETVLDAARKMQQLGVGSLPICGSDERLKGMLTDRDIVVKVLAEGQDPSSTSAGQLAQGKPVTIGADDSLEELARTMAQHQVKRLPVIDGHRDTNETACPGKKLYDRLPGIRRRTQHRIDAFD